MEKPKRRIPRWPIVIGVVVVLLACAAFVAVSMASRLAARQNSTAAPKTAQVTSITAVSSVESSGAVAARQSASLFWKTTGTVAEVKVTTGDIVKAGDVLMALDPASAPQNVIQAQADLIAAQKALDDLLHPSDLTIANAKKAVADAQDALEKAKKDLRNVQNPLGQSLVEAVSDAKLALDTAQANRQLANVDPNVTAYNNAVFVTNYYRRKWEEAKAKYDASNGAQDVKDAMDQAWNAYQSKLNDQLALQLRISTDQANKTDAVAKAQEKYDTAVANLNAAQKGPDATKLAVAQAKVTVAEANLADAQTKLDQLLNGADPNDIAAAQARVQAIQATLDSVLLKAPFDGAVLVINYQPGDAVSQTQAAVVLANVSQLHLDVLVDENDVTKIQAGDTVTVTFDSLVGQRLAGAVSQINPIGQSVQGLVKYTVRVDVTEADPRVLIGMTGNVSIVIDVQQDVLAVPLDAVQLDKTTETEFVNRVSAAGAVERVNVVSGQIQGDLVTVTGGLKPGDIVQLVPPKPTNSGSPFGGG
jgi:HlyD family secretion protein